MRHLIAYLSLMSILSIGSGAQQTITMGETNVLATPDDTNSNLLLVQNASLSQAATITSLSFYVRVASGNLILGVYDATGPNGGPGNLVAQTASTPVTQTGWLTLATPNVLLQPGMYWLAYTPNSDQLGFWVDRTVGQTVYVNKAFGPMPPTFPANILTTTSHWSFYATLTPANPTPTPTPTPTPPPAVTVSWDPPSTITGYYIYLAASQTGPFTRYNAGNNTTYTFTGLTSGHTYYVYTTSYDVNGIESCPSNNVSFVAP